LDWLENRRTALSIIDGSGHGYPGEAIGAVFGLEKNTSYSSSFLTAFLGSGLINPNRIDRLHRFDGLEWPMVEKANISDLQYEPLRYSH
jgi:hypothetical protein